MPSWVAIGFGALDVRGDAELGDRFELIVTPAVPGLPLFLFGPGAHLWRRLVASPISDDALNPDEHSMIRQMEDAGVVSADPAHPARIRDLQPPWLSSPFHELVYALLSRVAAENSIDIVFIKGPTLHAQGLRTREHSGDVDCWVQPGDETRLAEAMSRWGWTPAYSAFTGTPVLHSLTLRAGQWGSAVDVHSWFPGMAIDRDLAFSRIQEMTEERVFAGALGRTPGRDAHAIISALHDVRPSLGRRAGAEQTARAAETLRLAGRGVLSASKSLGSDFALSESLSIAFPDVRLDTSSAREPHDWMWRMQTSPLRAYIEALKLVPLRDRPRVFLRVLWPKADNLRSGPLAEVSTTESTRSLRWRRARQGLSMLYAASRAKG